MRPAPLPFNFINPKRGRTTPKEIDKEKGPGPYHACENAAFFGTTPVPRVEAWGEMALRRALPELGPYHGCENAAFVGTTPVPRVEAWGEMALRRTLPELGLHHGCENAAFFGTAPVPRPEAWGEMALRRTLPGLGPYHGRSAPRPYHALKRGVKWPSGGQSRASARSPRVKKTRIFRHCSRTTPRSMGPRRIIEKRATPWDAVASSAGDGLESLTAPTGCSTCALRRAQACSPLVRSGPQPAPCAGRNLVPQSATKREEREEGPHSSAVCSAKAALFLTGTSDCNVPP